MTTQFECAVMTGPDNSPSRIAYVVKRYPRFSETFIVNEILAHEAAGVEIHLFALNPPVDTHFQSAISQVRAPLTYLFGTHLRADALWSRLQQLGSESPAIWSRLRAADKATSAEVFQAACLAQEIRRRAISHLHAHFATTATTVARLASLFSGVPYTFTAHAKDIFHESIDPEDLAQKIDSAAGVVTEAAPNLQRYRSGAL
jgi:colanic acid/amylovoran biosynthesis glycosyltransferase